MRLTFKHLVRNASFCEWEHGAHVRNNLSALEQSCDLVQPRCSDIDIKVRCSNAIKSLKCLGNRRHDRDENPARLQNPKRPLLHISPNGIKDSIDSSQ